MLKLGFQQAQKWLLADPGVVHVMKRQSDSRA
jgi:hypothetical protein